MPRLRVTDLRAGYPPVTVLHGVSFSVADGAAVGVVGLNGSGKTTLLRAVSGLLPFHAGRVTGGQVTLDGATVRLEGVGAAAPLVRRGVAQVLEGRRLFADLTVEENLRAGAFTARTRDAAGAVLDRVLDRFPVLAARRSVQAGLLSGGEQQLLALARALMASPRLLLMDEPLVGLARPAADAVSAVVAEVLAEGTAVVVAEEEPALALALGAPLVRLDVETVSAR